MRKNWERVQSGVYWYRKNRNKVAWRCKHCGWHIMGETGKAYRTLLSAMMAIERGAR